MGLGGWEPGSRVVLAEVAKVDLERRQLLCTDGERLPYEFLILATGASHSYFGKDQWRAWAPGLKSLEDALEIRRRFLLTFVVVGGGPTGVDLAGTLKEMARHTLRGAFRRLRAGEARVILVEAGPRILPSFGEGLSEAALARLPGPGQPGHHRPGAGGVVLGLLHHPAPGPADPGTQAPGPGMIRPGPAW